MFVARVVLQRRVLCCNSWFAVTTESKVSFSFTSSHSAFLLNTMPSVCFMSWVKLHVCWNHGNKPSARCSHNRGRLPERYLQYRLTWSFRCITGVNVNTLCDSVDSELTETWVVGCTNQAPPSSSAQCEYVAAWLKVSASVWSAVWMATHDLNWENFYRQTKLKVVWK